MTATVTWWGHSSATWRDGDTTVLFDPVLTPRLGHLRRVRGPQPPGRAADADFVLISHLHSDHAHLPSLRLIPASAVLIVPAGSRRLFKAVTARGILLYEVRPGDLARFDGLTIRVLAADHDGRRYPGSPQRAPALGFLVERDHRCWYPGDTGPALPLDEVGQVDLALVPVGGWGPTLGRGHLDAGQAAQVIRTIRPGHAVPVHWGTWWPLGLPQRTDLIDLPGAAFAESVARLAPATQVSVLHHGQSVEL
ncbi:MAG: MBL fold metallo-hydrolase [Friedmanniella sp.]|jgi:L-ascorbate metabolism protein UlaG (beta-lactamase superfamily)